MSREANFQKWIDSNAMFIPTPDDLEKIEECTKMTLSGPIGWLTNWPAGDRDTLLSKVDWALKWMDDEILNQGLFWDIESTTSDEPRKDQYVSSKNLFNNEARDPYRLWSLPENFHQLKSCENCRWTALMSKVPENSPCVRYNYHTVDVDYGLPFDSHDWTAVQADFWNEAVLAPAKDEAVPKCPIVAFDCEMMTVSRGGGVVSSEIITFSAVDVVNNEILINCIVKPDGKYVDFKQSFTGFTPQLMATAVDQGKVVENLAALHELLFSVIDQETVFVGWGIAHDLRCLRLAHNRIMDLGVYHGVDRGYTWPKKLKNIFKEHYDVEIQNGTHGSLEDAFATAELLRFFMQRQPELRDDPLRAVVQQPQSDDEADGEVEQVEDVEQDEEVEEVEDNENDEQDF